MSYRINYKMAKTLIRTYIQSAYENGPAIVTKEYLCKDKDVKRLLDQLKNNGYNTDIVIRNIKEEMQREKKKLRVNVDAGVLYQNQPSIPSKGAYGFAVFSDGDVLYRHAKYLGTQTTLPPPKDDPDNLGACVIPTTNNTAEYLAVIRALEYLVESNLTDRPIEIHSDSQIVVQQIDMKSATKVKELRRLRNYAHELMKNFKKLTIVLIPREENEYVDHLVRELLQTIEPKQNRVRI